MRNRDLFDFHHLVYELRIGSEKKNARAIRDCRKSALLEALHQVS